MWQALQLPLLKKRCWNVISMHAECQFLFLRIWVPPSYTSHFYDQLRKEMVLECNSHAFWVWKFFSNTSIQTWYTKHLREKTVLDCFFYASRMWYLLLNTSQHSSCVRHFNYHFWKKRCWNAISMHAECHFFSLHISKDTSYTSHFYYQLRKKMGLECYSHAFGVRKFFSHT